MGKFLTLLNDFLRSRLTIGSIVRIGGIFALSSGTALGIVYTNYYNYWEGTIYRTQTVDFNILANYLPTKLSIYLSKPKLSQQDLDNLQQALDSNYGLFGIIVTDCKISDIDCPNQKMLYASKSRVVEIPDGKQRLISNENQSRSWLEKFEKQDFSNRLLIESPFVILRDPPPLTQEWGFKTPRDDQKTYFNKRNFGNIIGRAYFVRMEKPSFKQEIQKWQEDILKALSANNRGNRFSSRTLVYNSVALSAIVSGLIVFILMEFGYYRARVALENEAKAIKDKLNAEQKLSNAIEKGRKAIQENREAEEVARVAVERSEQAIRERQKAEEAARVAVERSEQAIRKRQKAEEVARAISQQAIQERQEAEEAARAAVERSEQAIQERQEAEEAARATVERSEQAIQERQEAEEAARVAEQDREQVRKQADDLYNSIEEAIEVRTRELQQKIDNLQRENDRLNRLRSDNSTIEVRTRGLQEKIGNLQRENDRLRSDNHNLAENLSLSTQAEILALNMTEHDFYFRERQSLLIDILKNSLNNVNENSRRQHILQDIIKNNLPDDQTDDRREEMKTNIQDLFQTYRRMDPKTKRSLERLGFEIISENTHYKLRFNGDNRYVVTLAKTPSDRRAGMNIARDICNLIF